MLGSLVNPVAKTVGGIMAAIRARPKVFAAVAVGVFVLNLFLPPLVLSVARKPWDHFSFNPWLRRLPEWLASSDVPLKRKVEFVPNLALFWFIADGPLDAAEWGFTVDVTDIVRITLTSVLFGAYFALWLYRRDQVNQLGCAGKASRQGGIAGALASVLGLSTGPCSVVGCGAPVMPVVGLALTGLSSGTIKFLSDLSRVATAVVLVAVTLGVAYFGWLVGTNSKNAPPPGHDASTSESLSAVPRSASGGV